MTAEEVIVAEVVSLTADETELLAECEATIHTGMQTFLEVGLALTVVKDSRLYRATHPTFVDYCCDRWQISARHAARMIGTAKMAKMIMGPNGSQTVAPQNERQIRALSPLLTANGDDSEAAQQQITAAWSEAVETAPRDSAGRPKITAKHVEQVVARRVDTDPVPARKPANRRPLPDAFRDAAYDMVKALERVQRLTADERFPRNAQQVQVSCHHQISRAVELIAEIADRVPGRTKESHR